MAPKKVQLLVKMIKFEVKSLRYLRCDHCDIIIFIYIHNLQWFFPWFFPWFLEVFSTKLSASISILGGISRFGFLDVSSRWFVTGFLRILNMNDIWVWVNTYRYIFSGLFTSINPSYFDVNRRGTIGFDTLPYID